ncbi:MAG: hypothetical protein U9M90_04270 [Patescibacteria group bacterium]|nr:hypothetical protein [Patescibacteria group bacterium]
MEETKKQKPDANPFERSTEQVEQTERSEDVENGVTSEEKEEPVNSGEVLDEFLKQHKADYAKGILKKRAEETKKEDPEKN